MRTDNVGLFWQDIQRAKGERMARVMPPIPETGWLPPTEFPRLHNAKALAIDVETKDPELLTNGPGWARGVGHLVGMSVGTEDGGRWYFPMRHEVEAENNMDPNHVLAWARDNLCDPTQPKIGANITYDVGWLRQEGVHVRGELHDVQFAEALLRESRTVNLDDLGQRYLGEGKESNILYEWCAAYYGGAETDTQRKNIWRAPPSLVGPYAISDVDLPFRVLEKQWPLMANEQLLNLYSMECRLIYLMIEMRYAGVTVDIPRVEELRDTLVSDLVGIDKTIQDIVGFEVNTNAAASIAEAFDVLGLYYGRTTKSNAPSFTKTFLKTVQHPIGKLIREKKSREKLLSTFIEGYIFSSHVNGKVYGQFHQLRSDKSGARSGRFSSSNPNLQNIPVRSDLGKLMRKIFIPDIGHLQWRRYDYSQIEYRGMAHYAVGPMSDQVRQMYQEDPTTDFHTLVQGIIRDVAGQELERKAVKNVNFGTAYGMGVAKLATDLGLSLQDAKTLLEAIHGAAPFLKATMNMCMDEAQELGYITTILGRRSRFDTWEPGGYTKEKFKPLPFDKAVLTYRNPKRSQLHKALNRRLQGSAADLIKAAMLKCWEDGVFDDIGVPRLTVHDELDFSDPGGKDEGFKTMKHIMETALPFRVPILVDTEIGPNWGDAEQIQD